ncbi:hypothetical protein P3T23_006035 [Paraburkholderia sp. GAS448]
MRLTAGSQLAAALAMGASGEWSQGLLAAGQSLAFFDWT